MASPLRTLSPAVAFTKLNKGVGVSGVSTVSCASAAVPAGSTPSTLATLVTNSVSKSLCCKVYSAVQLKVSLGSKLSTPRTKGAQSIAAILSSTAMLDKVLFPELLISMV